VAGVTVRVVVAEDEAIVRLDLKETLSEAGYEVVGDTGRGDEALALVRELRPDLAILDIQMPGMDGLSVAKELASAGDCAVLILTAYSQRKLVDEANEAGVMAYLVKPYQAEELIPAIEVALGRFAEMKSLQAEKNELAQRNQQLADSLETRRWVERAKGRLMDSYGMREAEAFSFIQKTAMNRRTTMREVARQVLEEGLAPSEVTG
jgi:AmiR/NasT family two-component response regulator